MTVYEAATSRRTIRKFTQKPIPLEKLEGFVNAARLAPSGANMQPLKYAIVNDPAVVQKIFENVKWAAYIAPAGNPAEGEKPTAFIIVLADTKIRASGYEMDAGAAIENLILSAWEEGIGCCWMASIDKEAIRNIIGADETLPVISAIALGYKGEEPKLEVLSDSVKYWKDDSGRLHVPKRSLKEVLFSKK